MACNCTRRWKGTRFFPVFVGANKVEFTGVADQGMDCRTDLEQNRIVYFSSPYNIGFIHCMHNKDYSAVTMARYG
jgi:hypothetical protein